MTAPSWSMIIAVGLVTFVAGYSIVSYIIRKFKAARDEPEQPADSPAESRLAQKDDE